GPVSCVYLARDMAAGQVVALKVLPHAWRQERASEGFEAAMAAWATLDHAHIIPVRGFGRTSQLLWYAMPHIDGRSLDDVLRNGGPLEPRTCLRLVEQLAAALHYAHGRGVTHGNVKPANVMMASAGLALLSDFALARALEAGVPHAAAASRSRLAHYVTPEERHARQLGPAADQYGLAVLALECLEGAASPGPRPPRPRSRPSSPTPRSRSLRCRRRTRLLRWWSGSRHARQCSAPRPPLPGRRHDARPLWAWGAYSSGRRRGVSSTSTVMWSGTRP